MQLFLNNELVDLYGNETIVGSYATNELGDLKSRQGVYSNTFSIPFTNRNRTVIQSAEVVTSTTIRPYQRLSARINVNGVPVVIGWGIITSASRSGYEIQVIGGNSEWYAELTDASLQDIDLNEFNHIFYPTDIDNSRINNIDWSDGYVYPNMEYGRTINPNGLINQEWYLQRPGMYGKYLFKRIINSVGFEPTGEWWNNNPLLFDPTGIVDSAGTAVDKFASFVPFSGLFRRDRNYDLRNQFKADTTIDQILYQPNTFTEIFFDNIITYPTNGWQGLNPNVSNRICILDSCRLTFNVNINLTNLGGPAQLVELVMIYTDTDGNQNTYDFFLPPLNLITTYNLNTTVTLDINPSNIRFNLVNTTNTQDIQIDAGATFEIISYEPLELSDDELNITPAFPFVTLNTTLPDVTQVDFLKWYIQKFNLIFNTDNQTGLIDFLTLDDVIANLPNAYDWSLKLDLMSEPVVSFIVGDYGQKSYFKDVRDEENNYTKDNTIYLEGTININDENLDKEVTIYETEFSPIYRESDTYNGFFRMGYVPKYRLYDETLTGYDPNDNANFEELEAAPYMGLLRFEPYNQINITGLTPLTDAPAVHGERITWNKIIPEYYQSLQSILNYSKIVTCLIRLDETDINGLDFSRPVWIDYFDSYFYINKINQFHFTDRASTEVELIKINYDYFTGSTTGEIINNNIMTENLDYIITENNDYLKIE